MIIDRLETINFRNLVDQAVAPGPRFNVLSGDNAQGKTNFLEAVYLVACLRSFKARRTGDMVRLGRESGCVRSLVRSRGLTRELEVSLRPGSRQATLDGKRARSTSSYLGGLNVVLFVPDDVQIPRGSPGARRRMLDRAVATLWPAYLKLSRDYLKTIQSRNRILRQRPAQMNQLLDAYDQQLAELGGKILAGRIRYLAGIQDRFAETFERISKSGVRGSLVYLAADEVLEAKGSPGDQARILGAKLKQERGAHMARQSTTTGPHTHDIDLQLDALSTRSFGSQGQLRALMLAFKIAQIENTHEKLGHFPVLLLDDVSSELDSERNEYLFDFLMNIPCQAFLTTTNPDLIPIIENRYNYQVVNGNINKVD